MQKFIQLILVLLCATGTAHEQLSIGDDIPSLVLSDIDGNEIDLQKSAVNVLVIDFWATTCGPCIPGLEHLADVQEKYSGQVEVVSVTTESEERVARFREKRPLPIVFANDTARMMQSYFPHRMIPHSVVVKNGVIVAITAGSNLTDEYFEELLSGEVPELPLKADMMTSELYGPYFQVSDDQSPYFDIQPGLEGMPAFTQRFNQGPFNERRVIMMNLTVDGLFRMAYGTTGYRLVIESDPEDFEWENVNNRYCLDLIVAEEDKDRLDEILKKHLHETFPFYEVSFEQRELDVVVLKKTGSSINLPEAPSAEGVKEANGDHYSGVTNLGGFANYLEGFGIVGYPVEDLTGESKIYEIDFHFYPEDSDSFHAALKEIGLKVGLEKREIEVLVIKDNSQP